MTTVFCNNEDCIHCDDYNYTCKLQSIRIGDDIYAGCEDYEGFINTKEYQTQYYKAVWAFDGNKKIAAKAISHGKRIEYNGYVFYTEGKVTNSDFYSVTDERTGCMCGQFFKLKDTTRWERFVEYSKKFPDVASLPLAIFKDGNYKIVKEEDNGA